jgi:peptide-methionine (S)-S-oxide reductase
MNTSSAGYFCRAHEAPVAGQGDAGEEPWKRITLGAGCFWCVEAIFEQVKGIRNVRSGYMGGTLRNPTYKEVCSGRTGHAEVVDMEYRPDLISLHDVLEIFFGTHDPTTLNRQGADVGTQYRSVVFCYDEEQSRIAKALIQSLNAGKVFQSPIVTEVSMASPFYVAENYHQEYFRLHGEEPYCRMVVKPKVEKFQKRFAQFRRK